MIHYNCMLIVIDLLFTSNSIEFLLLDDSWILYLTQLSTQDRVNLRIPFKIHEMWRRNLAYNTLLCIDRRSACTENCMNCTWRTMSKWRKTTTKLSTAKVSILQKYSFKLTENSVAKLLSFVWWPLQKIIKSFSFSFSVSIAVNRSAESLS